MDALYHHALKLLRRRDYTEKQLRDKLEAKFGDIPAEIFSQLRAKHFLDDSRYAGNFANRHTHNHPDWIRESLLDAGVGQQTVDRALAAIDPTSRPSLRDVIEARMLVWRLRAPLQPREAARLFRAMARLGYPEDDIREELERLQ